MKNEIWKPIEEFPGYDVSNHGRIRSYHKLGHNGYIADEPQRILKDRIRPDGRVHVTLRKDGKSYTIFNARMMMHVFVGPRPSGMEVCHNDGNPRNNDLDNLRYDTRLENARDWIEQRCGLRTSERDADIRKRYLAGESAESIGERYGIGAHRIKYYICPDIYKERRAKKVQQENERAVAIRLDCADGMTYVELGEKYDMHPTTVRSICLGDTFKDAGGPIAEAKKYKI